MVSVFTSSDEHPPLFREVQRFQHPLLWAFLIVGSAVMVGLFGWGMVQQLYFGIPWGDRPMSDAGLIGSAALGIGIYLGLIALFRVAALYTEIREDGLYVRFAPFHRRAQRIAWEDIRAWQVVRYRPVLEYGGWGLRYGRGGKAYNVSGNVGLRLTLAGGEGLLIGTRRGAELEEALASVIPGKRR